LRRGARLRWRLEENVTAAQVELTDEQYLALSKLS
jgi:hypothetical protein